MRRLLRMVLSPTILIVGAAVVLGLGMAAGKINILPKVHAATIVDQIDCTSQNPECCVLDDQLQSIPAGYHKDLETGECVADPPPQVLSESTTVADPAPPPQVLGASIGK